MGAAGNARGRGCAAGSVQAARVVQAMSDAAGAVYVRRLRAANCAVGDSRVHAAVGAVSSLPVRACSQHPTLLPTQLT